MTRARTASRPRHARGYALAIVMLVSVLLGLAVTSLFFALGSATEVTSKALKVRKAHYACDGVANLGMETIRQSSTTSTTITGLNIALSALREKVIADGVLVDDLSAAANPNPRRSPIPSGPLQNLEVSVTDVELRVALPGGDMPPCQAKRVQPLASLSIFQFAAVGVDTVVVANDDDTHAYTMAGGGEYPTYVWSRLGSTVSGFSKTRCDKDGKNCKEVRYPQPGSLSAETAPLSLPAELPPIISSSSSGGSGFGGSSFGGSTTRSSAPGDLRTWLRLPKTKPLPGEAADTPDFRGGYAADLRIIDGNWYVRRLDQPPDDWPGELIWSDHPCKDNGVSDDCSNVTADGTTRRLYSRYERTLRGFVDGLGGGGAGVVSYGSVARRGLVVEPVTYLPTSVCKPTPRSPPLASRPGDLPLAPNLVDAYAADACDSVVAGNNGAAAAIADAARGGFFDAVAGAARTPINLDLAVLGAAFATRINGELGTHLCLPRAVGDAGGCARVFNGIVYVGSTGGSPRAAAPSSAVSSSYPSPSPLSGLKLPHPLCGTLPTNTSLDGGRDTGSGYFKSDAFVGCDDADYASVDAVRLVNAADLRAFAITGLTVITDLPVYVHGDFNVVPDRPGPGDRSLFMMSLQAARVTVLSDSFNDAILPPQPPSSDYPFGYGGRNVRLRTSLFAAGLGAEVSGLVRAVEPGVDVDIDGSLANAFILSGEKDGNTAGHFRWYYPPEILAAQPPGTPQVSFVMAAGQ